MTLLDEACELLKLADDDIMDLDHRDRCADTRQRIDALLARAAEAGDVEARTVDQRAVAAEWVGLWDAINEYAAACGGETGFRGGDMRRMAAVSKVEDAMRAYRVAKETK